MQKVTKSVSEIDVFSVQDNYANPQEPTESQVFTLYGLIDFEVQYWDGANWLTLPGGSVTGNNKVWRKFLFNPIATSRVRLLVTKGMNNYSRLIEIEAYESATSVSLPNVASQANGGIATSSSNYTSAYTPASVNNGDRKGINWDNGGGWIDGTPNAFPDWLQIAFNGAKSISEIDVFSVQDAYSAPQEPTAAMSFSLYGITDFDVQYWNGSSWATVPGGSVTGNNLVWRKFTFPAVSTTAIRINIRAGLNSYSRLIEVEAY